MTIVDIDAMLHDERDGDVYLETYEQYKDVIETSELNTPDQIVARVRLTSDYAAVLHSKCRYSAALPYLNQSIQLWEVYENEWNKPLLQSERYEKLRFFKGVALSNLKKPKDAKQEFEWLVANYPQNELYANWILGLKKQRINRFANVAIIIAFVGYLPRLLFGDSPTADIGWLVFQVFFVIYLALVVYVYFAYPQKKE